jgi:MFS transporter, SET family, sugar efflux transporter
MVDVGKARALTESGAREQGAPAVSAVGQVLRALTTLLRQRDFRVVISCSSALGLAVSFVLPFMSLFATLEVKMSLGMFGAFMTLTAVANMVISTLLANRSDTRYSRRTMLLWGSGAGALGYLGYAFARQPWQLLLIGACVLGVASLTFSQLFAYARELLERSEVPPADAPLYMNAIRMSFALSWTVGPALAAAALRQFSFVGLFCGAASLYVLFFLLVLRYVPATVSLRVQSTAKNKDSEGLLTLFADRSLLAWFAAFVFVLAAHTISMSNMSLFVLKVLGGDEANVGIIFSLAPVFELPFMLYFGLLATRIESSKLIRIAMALAVVYYVLLSCVHAPYQIYPLQFLSAAIVSVTSGIAITFFQNKLPERLGAATNLYSNASRIGSTSAYLMFAGSASRFGHRGTYVLCAVLAAASLLLSSVPDKRRVAQS